MSEQSPLALLRRRILLALDQAEYDQDMHLGETVVHLSPKFIQSWADDCTPLLDIVEAVAAVEPYEPAIGERHELECLFCGELGDRLPNTQTTVSHTPDCAYMRARELCGMEQDGAK